MIPDFEFPKVSPDNIVVHANTIQPEVSIGVPSDCRIELSPEPDFPKTSTTTDVVDRQPELSHSDCRIELSPEPDFPKASTTVDDVGDVQPEISVSESYIDQK